MIDLSHNDETGLTAVHDDVALDAANCLMLGAEGACAFVFASGQVRTMPRSLPARLRGLYSAHAECTIVRLDGDRAVSSHVVPVKRV